MKSFIFGEGQAAKTPQELARMRAVAEALMRGTGSPRNVGEGLNALGSGLSAMITNMAADDAEQAGLQSATGAMTPIAAALSGPGAFPPAPGTPGGDPGGVPVAAAPQMDPASARVAQAHAPSGLREGIVQTASSLGIDPVDLATAISYETAGTFDPLKRGPTTQWGQHRGLIQFGEPQAREHGVNWDDPIASQLGADGAVASYLRKAGVQPGMGLLDIYSAINAGAPGLYNRSDANNGGAPGTVRDKVEQQMGGHRQKALALLGDMTGQTGGEAINAIMSQPQSGGLPRGRQAVAQALQAVYADRAPEMMRQAAQAQAPAAPVNPNVAQALAGAPAGTQGRLPQAAPPLPAPRTVGEMPVASVPQQIQQPQVQPSVAQALVPPQQRPVPTGPMPEMAGNTTHIDTERGPTMQQIMAAAANPWLNDSQRGLLNTLMSQQMAERDPLTAMQREKAQLELEKLRNPPPGSDWSKMDDGRLFNQRTGEIKEVGGGSVDAPTVQKLKLPDGSELAVQWNGETKKWDPIDAPQGGGGVTPPKKLTESQSKLTLFQSLQTETQPVLLDLEKQWNPANLTDAAARSTPVAGNFFQSEQGQMYNAAATAWAEGALRIATGAAATPEEMERTKKAYFAQPGDTPNTIAFKAQMREMYNRSIDRSLSKEAPGTLPMPSTFAKKFDDDEAGTPPPGWEDDWEFLTPEERQKVLGNG